MESKKGWVALLDEDEDDYIFWRQGFESWATHLELHWFGSVAAFISAAGLGKSNPVAVMMDGVIPRGEEAKWLSTMLLHPSCAQTCMIILSGEMKELDHQSYMNLGATDHFVKPVSLAELEELVLRVSNHIAARK